MNRSCRHADVQIFGFLPSAWVNADVIHGEMRLSELDSPEVADENPCIFDDDRPETGGNGTALEFPADAARFLSADLAPRHPRGAAEKD